MSRRRRTRAILLEQGKASLVEGADVTKLLATQSLVISRKNLLFLRAGLALAPWIPFPPPNAIAEIVEALHGCERGWEEMVASLSTFLATGSAPAESLARGNLEKLEEADRRLGRAIARFVTFASSPGGRA